MPPPAATDETEKPDQKSTRARSSPSHSEGDARDLGESAELTRIARWGWAPLVAGCVVITMTIVAAWEFAMVRAGFAPTAPKVRALLALRAVVTSTLLAAWAGYYVLRLRRRVEAERARTIEERHRLALQEEHITQSEGLVAYARVLAHEVRAPLHGLHLSAKALGRATRMEPEKAQRYIGTCTERIEADASRLTALVNEYLAASHAMSPDAPHEPVDLTALVRHVAASLRVDPAIAQAPSLDLASGDVRVSGNRARLERLVRILMEHAARASGDGPVVARLEREREHARLTITDTGPHFVDPANVFRPFHPSERAGAGLALAVAHDIVRSHAGEIRAENLEGDRGVRFEFRLPLETWP